MLIRPQAILDIIRSGERFRIDSTAKMPEQGLCERCGYISSQVHFQKTRRKPNTLSAENDEFLFGRFFELPRWVCHVLWAWDFAFY